MAQHKKTVRTSSTAANFKSNQIKQLVICVQQDIFVNVKSDGYREVIVVATKGCMAINHI